VQVARGEQFLLTRRDPFFASRSLTLRAVAVLAAVVRNGGTMPAAGALIEMTAKCGGVRHRATASSTLTCFQPIHWRFRSMKAAPALRIRSAISSGGGSLGVPHGYRNTFRVHIHTDIFSAGHKRCSFLEKFEQRTYNVLQRGALL
jgi:hypothetical protein